MRFQIICLLTALAITGSGLAASQVQRSGGSQICAGREAPRQPVRDAGCTCGPAACGLACGPAVCVALEMECTCGPSSVESSAATSPMPRISGDVPLPPTELRVRLVSCSLTVLVDVLPQSFDGEPPEEPPRTLLRL